MDRPEQTVDPDEMPQNVSSGTTLFLETIVGSKLYLFKFYNTYGKELRCPNT